MSFGQPTTVKTKLSERKCKTHNIYVKFLSCTLDCPENAEKSLVEKLCAFYIAGVIKTWPASHMWFAHVAGTFNNFRVLRTKSVV